MTARVLNVGGGSRDLPSQFDGWEQTLLDIDPACQPDICTDAKNLVGMGECAQMFDAVYCSHCLEHFYQHDVPQVLAGFVNVLRPGGSVQIICPDLNGVINAMRQWTLDINDVWYRLESGAPITFHDAFFGWSVAMKAGKMAFAHRCGFTAQSLSNALTSAGLTEVQVRSDAMNLFVKGTAPCR